MDTISTIGTVVGTASIIITGIWFLGKKFFSAGNLLARFEAIEESIKKLPLIELSLISIKESIKNLEERSKNLEESGKNLEESGKKQEESIKHLEESSKKQEESIKHLEESSKKQEEFMSKLPCARHEQEYNSIKGAFDTFKVLFDPLKETTITIANWVMKQDNSMIDPLCGKISPRTLTNAGKGLLEMSYGQTTVDDNLDFLVDKIINLNPKTAYDVEELSMKVLLSNTGETFFNSIKDFIYYAPEEIEIAGSKIKIELNAVIRVMSLYLRDEYLKKHPFEKSQNPYIMITNTNT
jgi:hypothetical protein